MSFARRALILSSLLAGAALAPAQAMAGVTLGNWDAAQQREVVRDGLMSLPGAGSFQGAAALTAAQADAAMAALATRLGTGAVQIAGTVTVWRFDALVVDCSGFVWRVFKLSGLPWGNQIGGRTAAQMAQEIPRRQRLHMSQLKPGDILFFGTAHFNSTATEQNVIHTGIYLGDNWVIHSSSQGVYVLPLKGGWLGDSFAWGRRVIH